MIYDYIIIGSGISGLYLGYLLQDKKMIILEVKFNKLTFMGLGAGIIEDHHLNMLNLLKNL